MATVVFLNGCFWGSERALRGVPGTEVTSGYAGGDGGSPTYYNPDRTGHAEAVRVDYDPDLTTLADRLAAAHAKSVSDPSPPSCPRYRRAVLCGDETQAAAARRFRERVRGDFDVEVGFDFHPAEAYHRRYYDRVLGG